MKVTIEIPDTTKVMTYQAVYDDYGEGCMKIISRVLDTAELNRMLEEQSDENP
jgi:hypothetical protein